MKNNWRLRRLRRLRPSGGERVGDQLARARLERRRDPRKAGAQRTDVAHLGIREQRQRALELGVLEAGDREEIDEAWPPSVSLSLIGWGFGKSDPLLA